jgi:hypothetical protein
MPRDGMSQRPGARRIDERCCWPCWVAATLGEPAQQLRVELASSASAVMVDVDIETGLRRPLEGSQALQRLATLGKTDDLVISLEDEPFVGGAKPIDARSHLTNGRDVDFPIDRCGLDIGAVDRQARGGILC